MIDINNPANYKNCIKKQADYWLCKPPKGTIIVNKLEQYELLVYLRQYIPTFNSRCYLTAEEANAIMNSNSQLYNYLLKNCYVINDTANMVLCGTEGEMWVTNWDYVCNNYLIYSQNGFVSIPSVINSKIIEYNGEKLLDWCRVTVKATGERKFACFVPVNQKGGVPISNGIMLKFNTKGVQHGKGDFIVCDSVNGKPNLQSRWVVNGLVFSNTYDNRGWSDKVIVGRMGISEPQKLWIEIEKKSEDKPNSLKEYLLNWFTKNNIQNACDFINTKNPKKDILEGLRTMTSIANYLMSNHGFTKFESNEEEICADDIEYFSIFNGDPNGICLNIYYANNLCGWNYSDENGEFYDEPYKVECRTKKDIDDFINVLSISISTFELLQKLFESTSGAEPLLKDLNSLSSNAVDSLNKISFNYRVLSIFVKLMLKACKQLKASKVSFDYNLESSLRFDITIDGNLGTFDLDTETNAISAFFYYGENDDFFETTVAYSDYDEIVNFFNRVKTGDASLSDSLSVKFLDMPKNVIAFNESKAYFNYDNKKYCSELGDFIIILKQICQQLDAEVNFTSLLDIEDVDYSDVTELPSSDFINKFFSSLDNAVRVCVYNKSTDYIKTTDLSIATFVVLNYTRVKRVYGKIVYSNGIELFVNISKSTLALLKYEHPELVSENLGGSKPDEKFISLHYYQLMLRMGLLRCIYNIKRFKLEYMHYNQSIFGDKLSHTAIISIGNYDRVNDSTFDSSTIAHHIGGTVDSIVFNGRSINLQDDLSPYAKSTLIHEMCHGYVKAIYGTPKELEGEDGGTYMHLGEWCKDQWFYHGKRFAETVKMASEKSGYSFNDIFGYGIGHSNLLSDKTGKDCVALISKNAFNLGQSYRTYGVGDLDGETLCRTHGIINCKCNSKDRIVIPSGRYVGMCRHCGELIMRDDCSIGDLIDISIEYFDVIDRVGIIATSKCDKCGGSIMPIVNNSTMPKDKMKAYLVDLAYANRYLDHLLNVCNENKDKYVGYFNRNYNCDISIYRGQLPFLCVDIFNNSGYKEKYKFFISCANGGRLRGKLYRDYDLSMKGRLIRTFRINTDRDILKFLDYTMSYIRKDLRDI